MLLKKRIKQHKKRKIFLHKFTARALYFFFECVQFGNRVSVIWYFCFSIVFVWWKWYPLNEMIYNNFKLKKACYTHWVDISNVPSINAVCSCRARAKASERDSISHASVSRKCNNQDRELQNCRICRELEVQNGMTETCTHIRSTLSGSLK